MDEVTQLLNAIDDDDPRAPGQLLPGPSWGRVAAPCFRV
jgi:hypothetical protein